MFAMWMSSVKVRVLVEQVDLVPVHKTHMVESLE